MERLKKEITIVEAVEWVAGGEHIKIVPNLGFSFEENPELLDAAREKANELGIDISNYAIGANFIMAIYQLNLKWLKTVNKHRKWGWIMVVG